MFKLAKASGVRIPDFVDHIPAALEVAEIENGALVAIVAGELDLWTTPGVAVAGILVNEAGDSRYAAPGAGVYTSTFKNKDQVTFIPVTTTLLIEADYDTSATADPAIGGEYGIDGAGLVDPDATTTKDFRVVNFKYDKAGDIAKVLGFFLTPGYFVS